MGGASGCGHHLLSSLSPGGTLSGSVTATPAEGDRIVLEEDMVLGGTHMLWLGPQVPRNGSS